MKTPYFLIHEDALKRNIEEFSTGMKESWDKCKTSYSVKTNSLPWVLSFMNENGIMAEVVSEEEMQLALMCGYKGSNIVYNGPIKTKESFISAITKGAYVNIDSERELEWIKEIKPVDGRIGVRVNVPPEVFSSRDIEYEDEGYRFGFSDSTGDFKTAIETVLSTGAHKYGLHMHCNSITRSPEVYRAIAKYAVYLCDKYKLNISFLDVGGGFFGGVPGKTTPKEYFDVIASELKKSQRMKDVELIAEPGSAIIGSTVDLVTSVLDIKDTSRSRIVTTDGSRIFVDPLWKKENYLYSIQSKEQRIFEGKQIVCGYTCMDHDRIMRVSGRPELQVGDLIVYHRVGAYTMTFGGPFIRYFPDVYVKKENKTIKVRKRISVTDYYNMERC